MKSIIKAVATTSILAIVLRTMGFLFRIYLVKEIGGINMGIYQIACSIFFVFLSLTTSGIPLIISKLTAKYSAEKNKKAMDGITSGGLVFSTIIAVIVCSFILLFQGSISSIFASSLSMTVLILLLPSIISSSICASFRGNLWGMEKYATVSFIEIAEQAIRIVLCVGMFLAGGDKLQSTAISLSIACIISTLITIVLYFKNKGRLSSPRGYMLPLIKSSTPITMVRTSSSIISSLTALLVPFMLVSIGMSRADALFVFGSSVGMAMPLLYIPITVVGSLAFVMIPTLSHTMAKGNKGALNAQIESAITFSIVLACLFVPAFFVLGKPIGMLLYDNNELAGSFLSMSAWILVPLAIESITSSLMNSLDLERQGFVNYCIGAIAMFVVMLACYSFFSIEIYSIAFGVGMVVSSVLDLVSIKKKTSIRYSFLAPMLKTFLLMLPTMVITSCLYNLTSELGEFMSIGIASCGGLLFFVVLIVLFDIVQFNAIIKLKRCKTKPLKQ